MNFELLASDGAARRGTLTLEQRGKLFTAAITATPFVPHRYHRKGA